MTTNKKRASVRIHDQADQKLEWMHQLTGLPKSLLLSNAVDLLAQAVTKKGKAGVFVAEDAEEDDAKPIHATTPRQEGRGVVVSGYTLNEGRHMTATQCTKNTTAHTGKHTIPYAFNKKHQ